MAGKKQKRVRDDIAQLVWARNELDRAYKCGVSSDDKSAIVENVLDKINLYLSENAI